MESLGGKKVGAMGLGAVVGGSAKRTTEEWAVGEVVGWPGLACHNRGIKYRAWYRRVGSTLMIAWRNSSGTQSLATPEDALALATNQGNTRFWLIPSATNAMKTSASISLPRPGQMLGALI